MTGPLHQLIVVAAIGAFALTLSACGRKGALDPPPGGYAFERGTVRTPTTNRGIQREQQAAQPQYDDEGRPVAPEGRRKKLPGDWLLD